MAHVRRSPRGCAKAGLRNVNSKPTVSDLQDDKVRIVGA